MYEAFIDTKFIHIYHLSNVENVLLLFKNKRLNYSICFILNMIIKIIESSAQKNAQ